MKRIVLVGFNEGCRMIFSRELRSINCIVASFKTVSGIDIPIGEISGIITDPSVPVRSMSRYGNATYWLGLTSSNCTETWKEYNRLGCDDVIFEGIGFPIISETFKDRTRNLNVKAVKFTATQKKIYRFLDNRRSGTTKEKLTEELSVTLANLNVQITRMKTNLLSMGQVITTSNAGKDLRLEILDD